MADRKLIEQAAAAVEAAKAAGAGEAWATASRSRSVDCSVRAGVVEKVAEATTQQLSLQVWVDGRYSSHRTTDLRPEEVARFAREAVELTRFLEPDPQRQIPDPALFEGRAELDLGVYDDSIAALAQAEREALCLAQNDLLSGKANVVSATSGTNDGLSESASVSSNGFQGAHRKTWMWLGSSLTMKDGEKLNEAGMWGGGPNRSQAPTAAAVADETLARALARQGARKGPTVKGRMVVHPSAAGSLIHRLLGSANGRSVQQGTSLWGSRLGKPVVSDKLVVVDDPLQLGGHSSRLFDGEGIAAKRMPLIEGGALQALYLNTYYARKLGMAPTTGGPSNRLVRPGQRELDAIIADLDNAVLVTSWLGGNADSTTGDFSLGMRGHLIKNGQIGDAVGEMNVTGNLLVLFSALEEVGSDPWPYSSLQVPTLVFDGVDFSGA
jgi:PmbA protein